MKFFHKPGFALTVALFALIAGIHVARTNAPNGPDSEVIAIAAQSTGKLIVAGRFSEAHIERRLTDGKPDPSFSQSWSMGGFNASVFALAIDPQDQVVVGGDFTNFDTSIVGHIARLHADGSLDTAFARAIGTGFDDTVQVVRLQLDGKLLVAGAFTSFNGASTSRIARLNADGTLDSSFDAGTGFDGTVRTLTQAPGASGGWLVGGDFSAFRSLTHRGLAGVSVTGGSLEIEKQ